MYVCMYMTHFIMMIEYTSEIFVEKMTINNVD